MSGDDKMLKKERLIAIQKTVDEKGIVDVNELIEALMRLDRKSVV